MDDHAETRARPDSFDSWVLTEPNKWECRPCNEVLAPGDGEALVSVHRVGVCGTDFHAFHGNQPLFTYPRVIGHELAVRVEQLGPNNESIDLKIGDKCCVEPYMNCGKCVACRNGKGNCCTNIQVLGVHIDGGLRTRLVVRADKLHKSDKLTMDQLAVVEPLCIGAHAVSRGDIKEGENVLVIGSGPVGMGVVQFAMAAGGNVAVMDISEQRLQFVKDNVHVPFTINVAECNDPVVEVGKVFEELPTVVFEATGNITSMERAFSLVAHGGRLVFVGHTKNTVSFENPLFHQREMTIMGSRNAHGSDFKNAVKLIEDNKVDVTPWITHKSSMCDFQENFKKWLDPATGVIKALVEVQ